MTDNQFDQFIRAKLKDHSAPVPPGLWEKINPDRKDDRKGFFLPRINTLGRYMIALALLGALAVGGYIYFNNDYKINNGIRQHSNTPVIANDKAAPVTATPSNQKPGIEENTIVTTQTNTNNYTYNKDIPQNNPPSYFKPADNQDVRSENNTSEQAPEVLESDIHFNLLSASAIATSKSELLYDLKDLKALELANGVAHTKRVPNILVCPSLRNGRYINPDWYAEFYVSPDLAFKSEQNISATPQYMQRKDSSESGQLGFSAGIRFVKPFNDNLLLKAGLQYAQINQKFVYRTENEIKTTTVVTTRQIIRGPGDTVLVSDTSILRQIGYRNNTTYNHLHTIDIPVPIGYQFGKDDDDFRVGVNAGVILNLSSWYRGVVLDQSSLTAVPADKASVSIYKSNIGLGLYGSLSFMKRLNENSHLFFEPYFRYNLSDATSVQAPFSQRFHIGGLAIGLRYNLNRK